MNRKFKDHSVKVYNWSNISELSALMNSEEKSIALCHGVFDLLHPGHIQHFNAASELAEVLIVSITADKYVNKGPGRPLFSQNIRAQTLAALENIDYVIVCESSSAIEVIEEIKPDFYVKGLDYVSESKDMTGMITKERAAVEKYGGKIHFTDEMTSSSSMLINKFFSNTTPESQDWIRNFKLEHGYEQVIEALDKISELNILVLGETIIDQYTDCTPLAKSSKDPILAFHQHGTNLFLGGVLAIASNCSNWVKKVNLISYCGENDETLQALLRGVNSNINLNYVYTSDRPTILKHRYVDKSSNSRIFEYYDFSDKELQPKTTKEILSMVKKTINSFDLVLAADYGHSFFFNDLISFCNSSTNFFSVNTQANAGNRGYNTISKYSRADFLTMNGAELQLELRKKDLDYWQIVPDLIATMRSKGAIVTLGGDGLLIFNDLGEFEKVPALADKIIDKVGAGDSVFAIASLLAKVGTPIKVIGFLSNLVAANEVSQLGHKKSLSQGDLRKHIKSLLG
jgi:rfaE bifunctional protein nucleotidyltransferase chain/domain